MKNRVFDANKIKLLHYNGNDIKKIIKEFSYINAGIFLSALGVVVFKNPNKFALGGVSGLALLIADKIHIPFFSVGSLMFIMNAMLLLLGFIFLGKEVAAKSVYGSFALSAMVWVLEILLPIKSPLTGQKFMELLYGVFIPGIGSALVFNYGATTGGTDILATIITKKTNIKVSWSLLISDFFIAFGAWIMFGAEAGLFSIAGVCIKSFVLDSFMESINVFKIVVVVSKESEKVQQYICEVIGRGATVHIGEGAYTHDTKEVITTVLNRKQAQMLYRYVKELDADAFITVSNSTKIIGKGFQRFE
ncbi:MAG: YitT family protein [Clostridiales bacterium]|nr:YitT family protein [Clostridiales bacterium]